MEFRHLRLQSFRNFDFLDLKLTGTRHFLCGANAQGKSNCLEALSLVTAMRSFRVRDWKPLAQDGCREWQARYEMITERTGEHQLALHVLGSRKQIHLDGDPLPRLGALLGHFPVVVLGSEDLQLLRGSPGDRRRWLDLTFSLLDPAYFEALLDYGRGLSQRNRLLKKGSPDRVIESFEETMAGPAAKLLETRAALIEQLRSMAEGVYNELADGREKPALEYRPDSPLVGAEAFLRKWSENRSGDRALGATRAGPHRDDLRIQVDNRPAREFGSDGQQRALVMALRFAQSRLWQTHLNETPVLLVDDVLGELDPSRRAAFWKVCREDQQVIASGTTYPPQSENWIRHTVAEGRIILDPQEDWSDGTSQSEE